MAKYHNCPSCRRVPAKSPLSCYFPLHKCKPHGHVFCNDCKNGNACPICGTMDVSWNVEKAYSS